MLRDAVDPYSKTSSPDPCWKHCRNVVKTIQKRYGNDEQSAGREDFFVGTSTTITAKKKKMFKIFWRYLSSLGPFPLLGPFQFLRACERNQDWRSFWEKKRERERGFFFRLVVLVRFFCIPFFFIPCECLLKSCIGDNGARCCDLLCVQKNLRDRYPRLVLRSSLWSLGSV